MRKLVFVLASLGALIVLTGCATVDYHQTRYYRDTLARIENNVAPAQESIGPGKFTVGVARVDITPPVGMPLQGYGARMGEPSKGVRDPLYARVLVMKEGPSQLVLVSSDLMAVTKNLYDAVFEKALQKIPLHRREFILFATHTHSGVGGLSDRFALQFVGGRFRPELFAETTDKIAAAIVDASLHTEPARIAFGKDEVAGVNRNRAMSDGPVDRELKVMRLTTTGNKPLAWLVNFAAHPTILGANWEFSADYPGALAQKLEHDGTVCLFANGAAGDLNTQKQPDESRDARVARVGSTLADKAMAAIATARDTDRITMDCRRFEVELPPVKIRISQHPDIFVPSWLGDRVFPRRIPVYLVRLDRELLLAVPAELSAGIGMKLKQATSNLGYDLFVIGYANDYIGYVMPERSYATKGYEAHTSFYGPQLDNYLTEIVLKMMETMKQRNHEAVE